jgi:hypothetical protein
MLQETWSKFQQSRAELARELETKERGTSNTKMYIIIAATLFICLVAVVLQTRPEFSREVPDTTPIVLDQSVGNTTAEAPRAPQPAAKLAGIAEAEAAIKEKRFDDAEKILKAIPANSADFQKADELLRTLTKARKKR